MSANTTPGPDTPRRTPVSAAAASVIALSIQPETAFAAVNSSGTRTSAGTSADCVGRVIVTAVAATAANTYASHEGPPARSTDAVRPIPVAWAR